MAANRKRVFTVVDYDLTATLESGQAFRWHRKEEFWTAVVGGRVVRLQQIETSIIAETFSATDDWLWLEHYLQLDVELHSVLRAFPDDEPMREAIAACRGLRLLRQDPWECLASFILSSTKQIVQIRQIVALLCERFGERCGEHFTFPTAQRLAKVSEAELRACKMGFRAKYLHAAALAVTEGRLDLESLRTMDVDSARAKLMELLGVGRKIADCVLLFAYGFDSAFPIDVWVMKALRQLYFPKRRPTQKRLEKFAATYFGARAGYAQQYLFHYMRTKVK